MPNQNADPIRAFFKEQAILSHPVLDHPMRREDEYSRELYLVMLCTAAQYGELITENQAAFLKRLLCSLRMQEQLSQYTRLAAQLEEKTAAEFLKTFEDGKRYVFALDLLILLGCDGQPKEQQLLFASELLESLRLTGEEIDYLALLARAVLEQDDARYKACSLKAPKTVDLRLLLHYVKEFASGLLMETSQYVYIGGASQKEFVPPVPEEENWICSSDQVLIEGLQLDLTQRGIRLENNRRVIFRNCDLVGGALPITAENLGELRFENCRMRAFSQRVLVLNACAKLAVENCEFDHCCCEEAYDAKGGVFLIGGTNSLIISGCRFKNCTVESTKGSYSCGAVLFAKQAPAMAEVSHNAFTSCVCKGYNKQNKDGGLFFNLPKESVTGSEFIGSNAEPTQ